MRKEEEKHSGLNPRKGEEWRSFTHEGRGGKKNRCRDIHTRDLRFARSFRLRGRGKRGCRREKSILDGGERGSILVDEIPRGRKRAKTPEKAWRVFLS